MCVTALVIDAKLVLDAVSLWLRKVIVNRETTLSSGLRVQDMNDVLESHAVALTEAVAPARLGIPDADGTLGIEDGDALTWLLPVE